MHFTLLPMLRENTHTVCDIPLPLNEVVSEWSTKFPKGLDVKLIDVENQSDWFIDHLNPEAKAKIADQCMPAQAGTLATIAQVFPSRLESTQNMYTRSGNVLAFMNELKADTKNQIAFVGHSHFFTYMTGSSWHKDSEGNIDET